MKKIKKPSKDLTKKDLAPFIKEKNFGNKNTEPKSIYLGDYNK